MDNDAQRMSEIQDRLLQFMDSELHTDEDHMFMATMLLKHSMIMYKTFLEDDQIKEMLGHVAETLPESFSVTALDDDTISPTRH